MLFRTNDIVINKKDGREGKIYSRAAKYGYYNVRWKINNYAFSRLYTMVNENDIIKKNN